MKYIQCKTKADFIKSVGFDWVKIVKTDNGYIGFNSLQEYKTWKAQK